MVTAEATVQAWKSDHASPLVRALLTVAHQIDRIGDDTGLQLAGDILTVSGRATHPARVAACMHAAARAFRMRDGVQTRLGSLPGSGAHSLRWLHEAESYIEALVRETA